MDRSNLRLKSHPDKLPQEYEQAIREQENEISKYLTTIDHLHIGVASYYEFIGKKPDKTLVRRFEQIMLKVEELNSFDQSYGRTNQLLYALFNTNCKRHNTFMDLQKRNKKNQKKILDMVKVINMYNNKMKREAEEKNRRTALSNLVDSESEFGMSTLQVPGL